MPLSAARLLQFCGISLFVTTAFVLQSSSKMVKLILWRLHLLSFFPTAASSDTLYRPEVRYDEEVYIIPQKFARLRVLLGAWKAHLLGPSPTRPIVPSDSDLVNWFWCSLVALWIQPGLCPETFYVNFGCPCQEHDAAEGSLNPARFQAVTRVTLTRTHILSIETVRGKTFTPSSPYWESAKLHLCIAVTHYSSSHGHNYVHFQMPPAFAESVERMTTGTRAHVLLSAHTRYIKSTNRNGLESGVIEGVDTSSIMRIAAVTIASKARTAAQITETTL